MKVEVYPRENGWHVARLEYQDGAVLLECGAETEAKALRDLFTVAKQHGRDFQKGMRDLRELVRTS